MKKFLPIAAVIIALFGVLIWWSTSTSPLRDDNRLQISFGNAVVHAEVVTTPEARAQGLSGRDGLEENEGMLFVFETDGLHSFWMKDMLFPIDMIWLSADKAVVHIEKHATPESYPKSFKPDTPARYVLEVASGWSDRHGITIGSSAQF